MNNASSLPNPSKNTFVEITQDGRHAVYLTDEQLALVAAMFGITKACNNYSLTIKNYDQLVDYCEENKIVSNDTIVSVYLTKCTVSELAAQTEKFVLEYQHRNNTGVQNGS